MIVRPIIAGPVVWTSLNDVICAVIAVLVREMRDAGAPQDVAFRCLASAPERIEAALTNPGALLVCRIDGDRTAILVSDDDAKLEDFTAAALADGAGVCGISPHRIARMLTAADRDGRDLAAFMRAEGRA